MARLRRAGSATWAWLRGRLQFLLAPAVAVVAFVAARTGTPTAVILLVVVALVAALFASQVTGAAPAIPWARIGQRLMRSRAAAAVAAATAAVALYAGGHVAVAYAPGASWSGLYFVAALVCWLGAVAAGVTAAALTGPRGLTWSGRLLVAGLVVAWLVVVFGVLRSALGVALVVAAFGAAVVARLGVAVGRWAGLTGDPAGAADRERWRSRLHVTSVILGIGAAVLILVTADTVRRERVQLDTSQIARLGGPVALPASWSDPHVPASVRDRRLERFYAPALRLDPSERWPESSAVGYSRHRAQPMGGGPGCPRPAPAGPPQPPVAARPSTPCLTLQTMSRIVKRATQVGSGSAVIGRGQVYSRVVDVTPAMRADVRAKGSTAAQSLVDRTARVVEYWLFYAYDRWQAGTPLGTLVQQHGGDWEWVSVGIDHSNEPVFVTYSEHCHGVFRPWTAAPVVAEADKGILIGGPIPLSHPLIVVARGSHANYPNVGEREPDWASCTNLESSPSRAPLADSLRYASFAAGAREATPTFGPVEIPRVAADSVSAWVASVPWYWGGLDSTTLNGTRIVKPGLGPASPEYQPGDPWDDPISKVFTGAWGCEGRVDGKPC